MPEPADCICARNAVSPYEGPSYPDEECPAHGVDAVRVGELIRLRNRIAALEKVEADLLRRAEKAEGAIEQVKIMCWKAMADGAAWRAEHGLYVSDNLDAGDVLAALGAPESPADASTAVSAATEAHGGAGEAQEG